MIFKNRKLNLQLFSEEPVPIDVDPEEEEEEEVTPPAPLPVAVVNTNQNPNPNMPSALPAEAWRNVEELLVTLSNNNRVNMTQLRTAIETLTQEQQDVMREVLSAIRTLNENQNQFNELLANATVEVPEQEGGDGDNKPQPEKRGGYLSRKGR